MRKLVKLCLFVGAVALMMPSCVNKKEYEELEKRVEELEGLHGINSDPSDDSNGGSSSGNNNGGSGTSSEGFTSDGAIAAAFSVNATGGKVYFSRGNLQYQASTKTWRFAEHQYDIIGDANSNISATNSGWIDLFGWGTSGYNNKYPYMTSTSYSDYGNGSTNIAGTNYDWGVYNAISNGGNVKGMWRTLTGDEWDYLFSSHQYGFATVDGVRGVILLPDAWSQPNGVTFTSGTSAGFTTNLPNSAQWSAMQKAGAVFLPAAGYRDGTDVNNVGADGYYWSSTYNDATNNAYNLSFYGSSLPPSRSIHFRYYGCSVRLVQDVK